MVFVVKKTAKETSERVVRDKTLGEKKRDERSNRGQTELRRMYCTDREITKGSEENVVKIAGGEKIEVEE